jgi:predicted DNA-binding protein
MENNKIEGYEVNEQKKSNKKDILYFRVDKEMMERLLRVSKITNLSSSEIIRQAVRKLLTEAESGEFTIKL